VLEIVNVLLATEKIPEFEGKYDNVRSTNVDPTEVLVSLMPPAGG
jgi:hypothetical protein